MSRLQRNLSALFFMAVSLGPVLCAAGDSKPNVRAITAFVTIDRNSYRSQLTSAVQFLNHVRDAVNAAGYDVATIRISTQPFPEFMRGLNRADALALLHGIDDL